MNYRMYGAALLLGASLLAGCGGDDDDDAGNPSGPAGDGAPISVENVTEVQAALTTTLGAVAAKGPGTHDGAVNGTVTIAVGAGRPAQVGAVSLSLDFDEYSDDGELYLDGQLVYAAGSTISIMGDIELSGTYEGEIELDLVVTGTQATGSISVNGTPIELTIDAPATGDSSTDDGSTDDGGASDGTTDSDVAVCTPDDGGQCLDLHVDGAAAIDATPFSVGIGGDAVSILGSELSILFLPTGEGTYNCGEGLLTVRGGSLNSAGPTAGSCTVQIVEYGLRIRGSFSAQTRNALGTADASVLAGTFDLRNPTPPGLLKATIAGILVETDLPTILNVSTVLGVSMKLPDYGLTTSLLVNLNANNVVTGTFDCADASTGTSIAISPSPVFTSTTATAPDCRIDITEISEGYINGTFSATLGNGTDPDIAVTDGSFRFASP